MTPDKLRELADRLEPMAAAPGFDGLDVPAFAAWLRQCAEQQPAAWRTFDGEGNYDFRDYESNEDYMDDYIKRNGERYASWVEPLYAAPAPQPTRDWTAIDAAIREYVDDYELIGEDDDGADACYTPTQRERDLIYDAINGLLADDAFTRAYAAPLPPTEAQIEAAAMALCACVAENCLLDSARLWATSGDQFRADVEKMLRAALAVKEAK